LTTTPIAPALDPEPSGTDPAPGAWIFPQSLDPEAHSLCRALLAGSADPQKLLDELAGQMTNPARHTPIANPIGYLRQLRRREDQGVFLPEFAHQVRRKREAAQARSTAAAAAPVPAEPRRPMPEAVRQMLAAFAGRRAA